MAARTPVKTPPRVFLLSSANSAGERTRMLLRQGAAFPLAKAVQSQAGAPLGEVFTFASGLYFRGKRAYAEKFSRPPKGVSGAQVITPGAGLVCVREHVNAADLIEFARVDIDLSNPRYRKPLEAHVEALAKKLGNWGEVVLLGSIATSKYTGVLVEALGERVLFPREFVGRGDMSRGGLLLRAVRAGEELEYIPVLGAVTHGARPPRLPRVATSEATTSDVPESVRAAWRSVREAGRRGRVDQT